MIKTQLLNKGLRVPLYHQLKNILLELVRNGELKPRDQLPAESLMAEEYGVSKATIRQALTELANEGVVERVQGRGTFVALPRVDIGPSHLDSFTVQMAARSLRPSSRVLQQRVIPAEGELAEKLRVTEGAPLLRLQRVRLADDEPMGIQTAHLPLELAPGLEEKDFEGGSLYRILREEYGLVAARAQETHSAIPLDAAQAALLGAAVGAPALSSQRLTMLASGRPIEFVLSVMRGDRYQVVLELSEIPLPWSRKEP